MTSLDEIAQFGSKTSPLSSSAQHSSGHLVPPDAPHNSSGSGASQVGNGSALVRSTRRRGSRQRRLSDSSAASEGSIAAADELRQLTNEDDNGGVEA